MMKADLPYYLTQFLGKYLPGERNASPHTIQSYSVTFKLLLMFLEREKSITPERLSMTDLTRGSIVEFLEWLESERGCGITTRNQRLVAIHSFVRFVQKQSPEKLFEFQQILNIPDKKCAKTVVPFLSGEEMKVLLSMPDPSTIKGLRDLALLAVLYDSAARVQEVIDLKVKDLRL
ncbi:MAG: site-specific integrase, partial [Oscillospiraceae bacterium]|nr:site-specific integrase [Oscillospiraceae bacterium]